MQNKNEIINGYIEGYYGKLLSWEDRDRILLKLKQNSMNYYFYAPKEDKKHRLNWKQKYSSGWLKHFKLFCEHAKINKVKIIVGLSPGLNFDFLDFRNCFLKGKISQDLKLLMNKVSIFQKYGASEFALLFDDLPNNFNQINGKDLSEGKTHAELANFLASNLNKAIYIVPRVYADQLMHEDKNYLIDYGNNIFNNNVTFYSGENIVSKIINRKKLNKFSKIIKSKVVIWDNFYANDYCPRRLFLGPLSNRYDVDNLMINPTGLIETDLLILDIVKSTKGERNPKAIWKNILKKHDVPETFFNISTFFLKPEFKENFKPKNISITKKDMECLEDLLWRWKSPMSREWYPFLLGLKHDLQLLKKELTSDRIMKINTPPLSNFILKK